MKKSGIYVVILLVLLLAAAVLSISTLTKDRKGTDGKDDASASASPLVTQTAETAAPIVETPAAETPTPTPLAPATPPPTAEPTPTPAPTSTPTPPPEPALYTAQGSFRSDTGTALNLVVNWTATGTADGGTLDFDILTESYSIFTVASPNAIRLTVGGSSYTLDAAALSYDGAAMTTHRLAETTVSIPDFTGELTASVTWVYRGSYGGTELETIAAEGSIRR